MSYRPTPEQIEALATIIPDYRLDDHAPARVQLLTQSDPFHAIICAAQAEALREFGRYVDGIWKTKRIPHPADEARRYADRIEAGE